MVTLLFRPFERPEKSNAIQYRGRYITKSDFDGVFSCFFKDLCEFVRHCNKIHIVLCLFVLFVHQFTISGRNGAITAL